MLKIPALALLSLATLLAPLSAARETYIAASGYWVDNNTDGAPGGALRVGWHFPSDAKYRISTDVEVEASYWEIDNVDAKMDTERNDLFEVALRLGL